ncbi:MAG: helix-turn-helix domain-containing protein [Oscillospiraceae bacterium]|nr:helix-turn-helix domain-containing protein [Oscillospiraceae bacterium]
MNIMRENEFEGSDILKQDFGEMVTKLRKKYNLTQEKLSEISGISEVYLRRIERGNSTVTWVIWLRLCTALNVDIGEIQRKYILPTIKERVTDLGMKTEYISE